MPRAFKLTQRTVETATCPAGAKDALRFDADLPGFGLRITAAGSKVFIAQYSTATGKRRVKLGTFGALTVEEARRAAKSVLGAAAGGADPFAANKAKAEAERREQAAAAFTFGKLVEEWGAAREGQRRPSYIREAKACMTRNLPAWNEMPARDVTKNIAVPALNALRTKKGAVAANRTLAYARAAYSWALSQDKVPTNPLRDIARPGREESRERVLTADELGIIWRGAESLTAVRAAFVRVLMLTMGRRDEIASMAWHELDSPTDPTVWTVPRERTKNRRAHIVHLSAPARSIIAGLPRIKGNQHVFAGEGKGPIGGFSTIKAKIVVAIAKEAAGDSSAHRQEVADWRFHDFRRAGVTALAGMGFAPHVCDRLLNHITGSIQGVAAVYQRAEFLPERRRALDAWATLITTPVEGEAVAGNVVPIRQTG